MREIGKFIVLEGQGFSGKSTQAGLLAKRLLEEGIDVVLTQHPGGIPSTEELRRELLERKARKDISPAEEFDLMRQSLDLLYKELVLPHVASGRWVVSSRYWPTVEVYQGAEGGFDRQQIQRCEAMYEILPRTYIFLSVSPEEIFRRVESASRERHAFNQLDMDIIVGRHNAYRGIAAENVHNNWVVVDGSGFVEEVHKRVWGAVKALT